MIDMQAYWMGRDLEYAEELTEEIRANAQVTVDRTNQLLDRSATGSVHVVRSGFRPRAINEATGNAATKSKHLTAEAVDIADDDRGIADYCAANQDDLVEIGLWCEDFRWTPTWAHFQIVPPKSGRRIYIPSMAKPLDPDYPVNW